MVRVVSGQPTRLGPPFNCPWFHLSPSNLPPSQRTLKRQEVGGPRGLAGEGVKALGNRTPRGSPSFSPSRPPQNCNGQRASRRRA